MGYVLEIQWKKTVILRKGKKISGEILAGLREPFEKVKEERQDKILGLNIAINGSKEEMVKKRIEKGRQAWRLSKGFFLNEKIDQRARLEIYNATLRPIMQYGMATQELTETQKARIARALTGYIRNITEREKRMEIKKLRWNSGPKREVIKFRKNKEIRREWKIPTFQSQLRREEWLMYMKGKKTQSIAYNTSKKIAEEKIKEMKTELKKLKEETKAYEGKAGYEEARPPKKKEIEKIMHKIKNQNSPNETQILNVSSIGYKPSSQNENENENKPQE